MATINKPLLHTLRSEIEQALLEISKKYNLEIKAGSGSFSPSNATLKLEISSKSTTGEVLTKEAVSFKTNAILFGLKSEDLGKTFRSQGLTFKITGLNTKAHKMPVVASCIENNKTYKFSVDAVKRYLNS